MAAGGIWAGGDQALGALQRKGAGRLTPTFRHRPRGKTNPCQSQAEADGSAHGPGRLNRSRMQTVKGRIQHQANHLAWWQWGV